jgi:hypothetical protein
LVERRLSAFLRSPEDIVDRAPIRRVPSTWTWKVADRLCELIEKVVELLDALP